jgi:putative transposase
MRRTNTFEVVPQSEQDEGVLRRLLDASASLWNQLTYARRQQFFAGESVWDCDGYYDEYVDVLGSATTQQITRITHLPEVIDKQARRPRLCWNPK